MNNFFDSISYKNNKCEKRWNVGCGESGILDTKAETFDVEKCLY